MNEEVKDIVVNDNNLEKEIEKDVDSVLVESEDKEVINNNDDFEDVEKNQMMQLVQEIAKEIDDDKKDIEALYDKIHKFLDINNLRDKENWFVMTDKDRENIVTNLSNLITKKHETTKSKIQLLKAINQKGTSVNISFLGDKGIDSSGFLDDL